MSVHIVRPRHDGVKRFRVLCDPCIYLYGIYWKRGGKKSNNLLEISDRRQCCLIKTVVKAGFMLPFEPLFHLVVLEAWSLLPLGVARISCQAHVKPASLSSVHVVVSPDRNYSSGLQFGAD